MLTFRYDISLKPVCGPRGRRAEGLPDYFRIARPSRPEPSAKVIKASTWGNNVSHDYQPIWPIRLRIIAL